MPHPALSFGVEAEMIVATLPAGHAYPNPLETRTVVFPPTPFRKPNKFPPTHFIRETVPLIFEVADDVHYHVSQTLIAAGLQVTVPETYFKDPDITHWEIVPDGTISPPRDDGYRSVGMEVKSPAFFYSADSLKELGFAMGVLTSTYVIAVNESTGIHVHVGNGEEPFKFDALRRLMAFLYAFEPQISTLHPRHRFNEHWASSLRYSSHASHEFQGIHGRLPRPLEGVALFLKSPNLSVLIADCKPGKNAGKPAYRFEERPNSDFDDWKPTVEFRQHAGSVNGEEIQHWVRTVVGIMMFVANCEAKSFGDLLSVIAHETFDAEDGVTVEPVLAETRFTIIDLLLHIDLPIPAAYYQKRGLYKIRHNGNGEALTRFGLGVTNPDSQGASLEPETQRRLQEEIMEAQRRVFFSGGNNAQTTGSLWDFHPHDTSRMQAPPPSPNGPASRNSPPFAFGSSWINDLGSSLAAGPSNFNAMDDSSSEEFPMRRGRPGTRQAASRPVARDPSPNRANKYYDDQQNDIRKILERAAPTPTTGTFLEDEMQDVSLSSSDEDVPAKDDSDEPSDNDNSPKTEEQKQEPSEIDSHTKTEEQKQEGEEEDTEEEPEGYSGGESGNSCGPM